MATQTQVLNLTKPEYTDNADIADINDNMDILDTAVGDSVKNITTSGTTYTVTKTDGTTFTFSLGDSGVTAGSYGPSANVSGESVYVPQITVDSKGRVTAAVNRTFTSVLPNSGVTAGTYGPSANVTGTEGATINVPQFTVDAKGRITSVTNRVYTSKDSNTTYSAASGGGLSLNGTAFSMANSGVTAGTYGPSANVTGNEGATINVPQITVDAKGRVTSVTNRVYTSKNTDTNTTYSAASGGGLSLSGTAFSLANSGVTSGSYGPSANATPGYGSTFNVPYITVDAKGRLTAASTKTVKIPASDNTNTWRGIQNVLTSTSTTDSLSANMGKTLNDKIETSQISVASSAGYYGNYYWRSRGSYPLVRIFCMNDNVYVRIYTSDTAYKGFHFGVNDSGA